MNAPVFVHPFTAAGLGPAPFKFVRYELSEYQACPGAPVQGGTSCDRCASGIKHVFWIEAADGQRSKVGIDCIAHLHDHALMIEARSAQRAYERELRAAQYRAEREERERLRLEQLAKLGELYSEECAMLLEGCAVVMASANASDFDRQIAETVYNEITSGVRCGVRDFEWGVLAPAYLAASLPPSQHIGQPKQRLRGLRVRYEGGPTIGLDSFYGPSVLARFRVIDGERAGAVLVWKTKYHPCERNAEVTLDATPVKHDTYKGVAQTFVNRCKVTP